MRPNKLALAIAAVLSASSLAGVTTSGPASAAAANVLTSAPAATLSTPVKLPGYAVEHAIFDFAHNQIFLLDGISSPPATSISVVDLTGKLKTTIPNQPDAGSATLDAAHHTLYVSAPDNETITAIDTNTDTQTARYSTGEAGTVDALYAGGLIWFSSNTSYSSLYSVDPATSTVTTYWQTIVGHLVANPANPDEFYSQRSPGTADFTIDLLNVSTQAPVNVATRALTEAGWYNNFSATTSMVAAGGFELDPADLSTIGTYPVPTDATYPEIAVSAAGTNVATVSYGSDQSALNVYGVGSSVPKTTIPLNGSYLSLLQFSDDGSRLYAVEQLSSAGSFAGDGLVSIDDPTKVQSQIALSLTARTPSPGTITGTGALSFLNEAYDGVRRTIHITRTDPSGTVALPDVTTDTAGHFTVVDTPAPSKMLTYTATFDGDAVNGRVSQSAKTDHVLPFDFNGDGYADLVVGTPLEDVGTIKNAGAVTVMYSGPAGVSGAGSVSYTEDSTSVPGTAETSDQFGWSQASGDFNGDGYADLVVSTNNEGGDGLLSIGNITVFYGSATGITTAGIRSIIPPIEGHGGGFFGETMAVGNFNGDDKDDLAVATAGLGTVFIYDGGQNNQAGLRYETAELSQASAGVPGTNNSGELWGASLSAGDINGDGYSDLAVGAPWDTDDHGYANGSVTVFYGSKTSISFAGVQRFTKDSTGVPGTSHNYGKTDYPDDFGFQVDLGDFNGDGKADLAVSAPGSPVTTSDGVKHEDAGTVTILYSSAGKIATTSSVEINQATTGMPGNPGKNDLMGYTMATGDSTGDGRADLAIFSPGDRYVTVVKGGATGLSYSTATSFTQATTGVYGDDTVGDFWGDSLRFANFQGSAQPQGLAVGADGKHSGQGSVTVLYTSSAGLTGTGSTYLDQDSAGVPGTGENGDAFGTMSSW